MRYGMLAHSHIMTTGGRAYINNNEQKIDLSARSNGMIRNNVSWRFAYPYDYIYRTMNTVRSVNLLRMVTYSIHAHRLEIPQHSTICSIVFPRIVLNLCRLEKKMFY